MNTAYKILALTAVCSLASCSDDPWWESEKGGGEASMPAMPTPGEQEYPEIAGCDLWQQYAEAYKTGAALPLIDFSYAGYASGEAPIPEADYREFNVADYGAVPDDGLSDRAAFEAAIAAARAWGKPAVVKVPEGRFELRSESDPNASIVIDADNIVLRGAGASLTELLMTAPNQALDQSLWNTPELITFTNRSARGDAQLLLTEVTGEAEKGAHTLQVASASKLYPGQWVLLKSTCAKPEAVAEELEPYGAAAEFTEIVSQGVSVAEYLQVKRVQGATVEFRQPIMHSVNPAYGWSLHAFDHHEGCGVEDISFVGNFTEPFSHHASALHDSGFRMLTFHRQTNGWVRRCRFVNVSEAVSVMLSACVSVLDCRIEGNGGHSAIRSQASSHVLLGRITDSAGQYHSVGVSKTAIGTVVYRADIAAESMFESHSSQPRATLLDACTGGFHHNRAGGEAANGPNHLADLTLWNYREKASAGGEFSLWSRNNRFLMPIFVGYQGAVTFNRAQVTMDYSHGTAVEPESLYEAQLALRLGSLPNWIKR